MWFNLLIAVILLLATLAGYYLIRKRIAGDSVLTTRPQRKPKQGPNELEAVIAAYHRERTQEALPAVSKVAFVSPQVEQERALPAPLDVAAPAPEAPTASSSTHVQLRKPFLSGPNRLLYLVLKIGLPEHLVFPNVRLADLVRVVNPAATPQARAQLAQTRIDFIVCSAELNVIALLDITDGNRADDVIKRQLEAQLTAGGCRYLRVTPNAIPKPGQIRSLVCGE